MRLSINEQDVITGCAKTIFGLNTGVILFGSRANDNAKGGDIDLLVLPEMPSDHKMVYRKKIQFVASVLNRIGDQKIDVVIGYPNDSRGIVQTAIEEGVRIC